MRATIRGKKFNITKKLIEVKIKGVEPDEGRKYFVEIQGREYPLKQVIQKTLGIPLIGFTTIDAYTILNKLNYKITERS